MNNNNNSLITDRIRRARVATFMGFMMIGAMMYIWSTGVSVFRQQLGLAGALGDGDFGLIALSIGVGSAAGSLFVGKLLDLYGAKPVISFCAMIYPLSIIPLGYISGFWFALVFGAVLGLFRGALDTALNAHGVQVERFYRRSIMSAFHASYSFGGFLLGMICSWLTGLFTDSVAVPFSVLGGLMFITGCLLSRWLLGKDDVPLKQPETHHPHPLTAQTDHGPDTKTVLVMIAFGTLLLGSMMGENAIGDWGQEYVHRVLGASTSFGGMAVSVFIGAVTFGRLFGDRLAGRFGNARVIGGSGALCVAGTLLTIFGASAGAGIVGFALFGLGLSCIAPLMVSSAGRKDPENAGRNIGIVNGIGFSGMLMGPAAITVIVGRFGLESLMYFPLILLGLLAVFGPMLVRTGTPKAQPLTQKLPAL
jgi:MFS family permease